MVEVSEDSVRALADGTSFDRGREYFAEGAFGGWWWRGRR
jgi:hypothetical protein